MPPGPGLSPPVWAFLSACAAPCRTGPLQPSRCGADQGRSEQAQRIPAPQGEGSALSEKYSGQRRPAAVSLVQWRAPGCLGTLGAHGIPGRFPSMFGGFSGMMTVSGRRFGVVQRGVCAVQVPWQPSFGTAEDRNAIPSTAQPAADEWQPSFGTAEDRNLSWSRGPGSRAGWQPSFGTAEDRNQIRPAMITAAAAVAAVLRDG